MKNVKKLLALALCFVLAALCCGVVGCKAPQSDPVGDGEDIPEGVVISQNGKEIYYETKEGKERLKISYTLSGYGDEWLQVIAANFAKDHPEYWIYLDGDPGLTTSMATKMEAGVNLSDIYMPLNSPWATYASYGWLEELSDVYAAKADGDDKTVYEKTDPLWQEYCTADYMGEEGKYSFPWTQSVSGIAYNKSMFDRYGWEIPETMDEMIALCEQILADTNGEIAPFVYPGTVGGYYGYLVSSWWLQSSGLEGVKEFYEFASAEVYNYNKQPRKGLMDALKAFDSLFGYENTKYSLRGSMSKNHTEAQLAFLRGEAAMIPNASWLECEMKEDIPQGFELRLMRTPYLTNAQRDESGAYRKVTYGCHPDYMVIPKQAANKEGAKAFLVYTCREDMLLLFTKYAGTLRPFQYDIMSIYDELTPFVQSCIDIWYGADSFFEASSSKLYKKGLVDMYVTQIPYPALIYGVDNGGTTVERFMKAEYLKMTEEWDGILSKAN